MKRRRLQFCALLFCPQFNLVTQTNYSLLESSHRRARVIEPGLFGLLLAKQGRLPYFPLLFCEDLRRMPLGQLDFSHSILNLRELARLDGAIGSMRTVTALFDEHGIDAQTGLRALALNHVLDRDRSHIVAVFEVPRSHSSGQDLVENMTGFLPWLEVDGGFRRHRACQSLFLVIDVGPTDDRIRRNSFD